MDGKYAAADVGVLQTAGKCMQGARLVLGIISWTEIFMFMLILILCQPLFFITLFLASLIYVGKIYELCCITPEIIIWKSHNIILCIGAWCICIICCLISPSCPTSPKLYSSFAIFDKKLKGTPHRSFVCGFLESASNRGKVFVKLHNTLPHLELHAIVCCCCMTRILKCGIFVAWTL